MTPEYKEMRERMKVACDSHNQGTDDEAYSGGFWDLAGEIAFESEDTRQESIYNAIRIATELIVKENIPW